MEHRPFAEHRGTLLWKAVERTITELVASGELSVHTAPEYVYGYVCRELVAKKLIVPEGRNPR
jgi:hypothetical protein